jgi:hypothetical protein
MQALRASLPAPAALHAPCAPPAASARLAPRALPAPARRFSAPRRARRGAPPPLAVLPIPNLFSRLVVPNPHPAPAVARTLLELLQARESRKPSFPSAPPPAPPLTRRALRLRLRLPALTPVRGCLAHPQAHPKWDLKKTSDHGEPAGPRMRLHIACFDKVKGHALLEKLQQELYEEGEKVCVRACARGAVAARAFARAQRFHAPRVSR